MARTYNVFISHAWDYTESVTSLRNLLNNRGYFNVEYSDVGRDQPINSFNTNYIKRKLREKIQGADVVIGMAGMYASYSDWMKWELDTARDNGIPIIGVIPRGATRLSKIVTDRSIYDVGWNTESIVAAIRMYSNSKIV